LRQKGEMQQVLKQESLVASGVARNWSWGGANLNFYLKIIFILSLCIKSIKIQVYLVHSGLGLGVQMPHCTPLATLLLVATVI
jgi:hypothetical protein